MILEFRPTVYMRECTHSYLWLYDSEGVGHFLTMETGIISVIQLPMELVTTTHPDKTKTTERVYTVAFDASSQFVLSPLDTYNPIVAFKKYQDSLLERTPEAEIIMRSILALEPGILPERKVRGITETQAEPKKRSKKEPKQAKAGSSGYSLSQLCAELKMDPSEARKILRTKKIEKPGGKWEWANAEAASHIRAALEK